MLSVRSFLFRGVPLAILAVALLGCPEKPNYSPAILVNPATLDFGTEEMALTFKVSNVWTSQPLPTFTVTTNKSWITVTPTTGTSVGPEDPVTITVTVERSLMGSGENSGTIYITAPGVAQKTVTVTAQALLVASFSASNALPFVDDPVTFTDESTIVSGYGPIISRQWDFGDGSMSTETNPVHTYTAAGPYTVTLTVQTATITAVRTRVNYITARDKMPPTADFTVSNRNPTAFYSSVQFVDVSDRGTAPQITDWFWDFGDGNTSIEQYPLHTFTIREIYTVYLDVYLAVTTDHGSDTEVKLGYIGLQPAMPTADFTTSNTSPLVNTPITFHDMSDPGSGDITAWYWEFGDGGTGTAPNPQHTYTTPGLKTVKLTVTTAVGSHTTTKLQYINVRAVPPTADFEADDATPEVGQSVAFTDLSTTGSAPTILTRSWSFGDGATSTQANPTHTYTDPGAYTVTLTVTTEYGNDTETKEDYIVAGTALDHYLHTDDGTYRYEDVTTYSGTFYRGYVLKMYSQTWDIGGVDSTEWWHWMTIIEPNSKSLENTALILIDGGSYGTSKPTITGDTATMAEALGLMGITFAIVAQVPNQPLVFADDPSSMSRTEDEIIAYSFSRYLDLHDTDLDTAEQWPALLPMTKSAVKGMDTVQTFVPSITNFVVAGASKRGWTTWLTAASDPKGRVSAAMPLVIDMLNMDDSFTHHHNVYRYETGSDFTNGYSIQVHDYVDEGVLDWEDTTPYQGLQAIVDPYMYRDRLTMPKYLLNGSKDEFFLPDSGQFYWDDLLGTKYVKYHPNAGHNLGSDPTDILFSAAPWYMSTAQSVPIPTFTWDTTAVGDDLKIEVTTSLSDAGTLNSVTLWQADTVTGHRDFRNDSAPSVTWVDTTLADGDDGSVDGVYTATVTAPPANTWRGAFVSLEYASPYTMPMVGTAMPYTFSTQVFVIPDTYPTP